MSPAVILGLFVAPVFAGTDTVPTYLALGESISFGFDPTVAQPWSPDKFTGYPEVVASVLQIPKGNEINASCPGETSASFLTLGAPDNGCQNFKSVFGLHTNYLGTQKDFAVSQLKTNKHINLVTLSIGGNELLILEAYCTANPPFATCVANNLQGVLTAFGQNLFLILTDIRDHHQGNYNGTLILMKQYSPSADPLFVQTIAALDQVMVQVGTPFGAKFADGFGAFQIYSSFFQNDPCKAGLLVHLTPTSCDVHPSVNGRNLLAATVLIALASR
jgi:hypothetical protein